MGSKKEIQIQLDAINYWFEKRSNTRLDIQIQSDPLRFTVYECTLDGDKLAFNDFIHVGNGSATLSYLLGFKKALLSTSWWINNSI